jgi:hypothetical protein
MNKRVIIVRRNCHEFGNILWSDMAIYAYAFMVNAKVWNLAVFENGPLAPFHTAIAAMLGRLSMSAQYKFLPPTVPLEGKFAERNTVFFFGWLFGNPEGLRRYRKELLKKFGPTVREEAWMKKILARLPADRILIGVHMRLRPFRYFSDGEFLVPPARVRDIVDEQLRERKLTREQVALVLVADAPVPNVFDGFITHSVQGNARANFLLLSKCSVVIGTNTTFSNLAAWFGDVSHIVTTEHPIDWAYYSNKQRYFENKYATFAFGIPGQG